MAKFRQLQARAMGAVRSKVQAALKHAAQQVQLAIAEAAAAAGGGVGGGGLRPAAAAASGAVPVLAEGAEVSLLYVRFRAAAEPSLKGLDNVWMGTVLVRRAGQPGPLSPPPQPFLPDTIHRVVPRDRGAGLLAARVPPTAGRVPGAVLRVPPGAHLPVCAAARGGAGGAGAAAARTQWV